MEELIKTTEFLSAKYNEVPLKQHEIEAVNNNLQLNQKQS
jgi:hypothetical protein